MNIVHIRKALNISQKELAEYLEISSSLLAMAERNERQLKPSVLRRISVLADAIETAQKAPSDVSPYITKLEEEAIAYLITTKRSSEIALSKLREELQAMLEEYDACISALRALPSLPDTNDPKLDSRWLKFHLYKFKKQMENCNPLQQANLKVKIAGQEGALAYINQRLSEFQGMGQA